MNDDVKKIKFMRNVTNFAGVIPATGKTKKQKNQNGERTAKVSIPDWQKKPTEDIMSKVVELGKNFNKNGLSSCVSKEQAKQILNFVVERSHNPKVSSDVVRAKVFEWGIKFPTIKDKNNFFLLIDKIWERSQFISGRKDYKIKDMNNLIAKYF